VPRRELKERGEWVMMIMQSQPAAEVSKEIESFKGESEES